MSFMSFAHKYNVASAYAIGVAALVTSFTLPAEISVIALLLAYPSTIYASGQFIGMGDEWYGDSLNMLWKLLLLTVVVFAVIYWRYGLIQDGKHIEITILESLYFSVTTWTTLGYGDFSPPPRLRHITSIQAVLGYVGMGLWIALINGFILSLARSRREMYGRSIGLSNTRFNEEDNSN